MKRILILLITLSLLLIAGWYANDRLERSVITLMPTMEEAKKFSSQLERYDDIARQTGWALIFFAWPVSVSGAMTIGTFFVFWLFIEWKSAESSDFADEIKELIKQRDEALKNAESAHQHAQESLYQERTEFRQRQKAKIRKLAEIRAHLEEKSRSLDEKEYSLTLSLQEMEQKLQQAHRERDRAHTAKTRAMAYNERQKRREARSLNPIDDEHPNRTDTLF